MSTLSRFTKLQRQLKAYQRRLDQSAATRQVLTDQLREKFGIKPEALAKTLKSKKQELAEKLERMDERLESFETNHGDKLQ